MYKINKQISVKQFWSFKVSFFLVMHPVMASEIVIDTTYSDQNTFLDTAPNGTSVVNISTPNTNGVSHNTYIQFNVPTQGTILNNSDREVQTQLAGYIYGNENVRNGSASLILNEVSGTNRSRLNGYLEVAGQSADVIVANPNGITVNGAGFINIPKATLTTGKVGFSGKKPIYDIEGGNIFIDGKGLDTGGTSSLELYTQAIKLNASLHANDLSVVTGVNHIDENGEVTSTDSEGKERPAFSIDSTALGGIYTNAISLVGTQKGVGVNLPSEMLVQDRLELSSDGKIVLGKVSVENNAKIRSLSSSIEVNEGIHASTIDLQALTDISLHGNTGATTNLMLLGNTLYNEGLLAAGINEDFTQAQEGLLNLEFTKSIYNNGILYATSGIEATAQTIINNEGIIGSERNILFNLVSFNDISGNIFGENVTFNATNIESYNTTIQSINSLNISSHTNMSLIDSTLYSYSDLNINAQTLNLDNTLLLTQNRGSINTSIFNNSNSVISTAQMYIDTEVLNNEHSVLYFSGDVAHIRTSDTFNNNNGLISANNNLILDAEKLDNRNGDLEAGDTLQIESNNVQIENSRFFAENNLKVTSNISIIDADTKFLSAGDMDLDFTGDLIQHGEILSNGRANMCVHGNLHNENSITANGSLNIIADTLNNNVNDTGASIRGGYLSSIILNGSLDNHGLITSSGSLDIEAHDIINHAGIASTYDLTLKSTNLDNHNTIVSGKDMHLLISDVLKNNENADIYAGNKLTISKDEFGNRTNQVENISAKIESGGDMTIIATDISNISATEITTTLQEVNGVIDITCGNWGSFSCPDVNIALDINLIAVKDEIIQENADKGIILTQDELQTLLTEEMIKRDREAYILNMYKDTLTTANELYFYELTASLESNEMIVKRTKPHKKEEFRKVDYTVSEEIIDEDSIMGHKEGVIVSGHDLVLEADNMLNKTSLIASSNDMRINGNLENIDVGGIESIDATINYSWKRKSDGGRGQLPVSKFEIRDVEGVPSQIIAGGTLSGNFGTLQNGMRSNVDIAIDPNAPTISTSTRATDDTQENEVSNSIEQQIQDATNNVLLSSDTLIYDPSAEGITLPDNPYGIFITNTGPDGPLIESNPEYTHYDNFISSDYMLERLGYDGSSQMRRLGDAMYETHLIRDAIINLTGQRYIGMAKNDNEQYLKLMNAGLDYAQEAGLQLGAAPTLEQLKELKEDLVWMEVKVIEGKEFLVPVLYLAKAYIKSTNANINANHIGLTVDAHLTNLGNIQSRQDMTLHTGTLTNVKGKVQAGANIHISTIGDLKNHSAQIKGASVILTSEQGSIVNKTLTKELEKQHSVGKEEYTYMDQKATIEASEGHLFLDAEKQINNIGANLVSHSSTVLKSKENIEIKTLKDKHVYDYTFSNGYAKGESVEHIQSNIKTGGQLSVLSDKDISFEATIIKSEDTYLHAKEKVNVIAAVDSKYAESYFAYDDILSSSSVADMKLEQNVKGTEIQSGNLYVKGNQDVSLESIKVHAGNSVQVTSETGNVEFISKDYTNASYHEKSSSILGGLISERSVDAMSETLLEGSSTKSENNIIVGGKEINLVASELESINGGIKLTASENVNIISGMEAKVEEHIREESGLSLGVSSGKVTLAEETTDSTKSTSYTNKASTLKANSLLIESGQDTNVIASNITAGSMRVDAVRDVNVLSDKDITMKNEEYSKKEIGIEFTLNSEEASVFAGYWEDKNLQNSTDSQVVSSNIKVRDLDINAKSTNVVGSNIVGEEVSIKSENIRILSDTTNTDVDAYTKSIKAGVEVGVKQNLSNTINAVVEVGESKSVSAGVARSLQAYDTIQSFSEQPVTAGVNAIYEESSTDTHSKNTQVVASSIIATNMLALDVDKELKIAGSDVASSNTLTINANNINISASEGIYRTETSSETKNANVGLYGTNIGQATVGYQENKIATTGTYQRNSQLYVDGAANISSKEDTILSGANIVAKDLMLNVGGDLQMESLQDTQTIQGSSKGGSISGNVLIGMPTGTSANEGKTSGEKAWVSKVTGLNGTKSVKVNVGGTTTLTGASITNLNEEGQEQGKLELNTQHLAVHDIKDIDTYDVTTAGIGIGSNDNAPSLNSVEYTNNATDKEQITRATIGSGNIHTGSTTGTLNRDTANIQNITKDKSSNTELYASNRTLELLDNPTQTVANLEDKLKDVGLATHVEILKNLPTSEGKKDKNGNSIREDGTDKNVLENFIDGTMGAGLDYVSNAGILPSVENSGGYVSQLAVQLLGDNRAGIVVEDKVIMEKLGLEEREEGDKTTDWDYEQVVMVKTEEGIKPISEVENIEGLEQVTRYRTNPDKQLVIGDPNDKSGNTNVEEYKIRISTKDIKESDIKHVFTNGMFNNHDTAVYNQQTQQNGADAVLNYNQMHGVVGDMIENVQDHMSVNGADILAEVVTFGQAEGSVDGIGSLGTGGSQQTGNLIKQMTNITEGSLTIGAHSQGTMMTQNGLDQHKDDLGDIVQGNVDANFLLQYSGAPVNHVITENMMTEIYGGKEVLDERTKGKGINDVFRSQVAPEDFVGSVLGYQSAGVSNSENLGENMKESTLSAGRLFGVGGASTHSYYGCVIGCGNENYTPDIRNYINLDSAAEPKEFPIEHYYKTNFLIQDANGRDRVDVNLDLLPTSTETAKEKILELQGDK